MRIGNRGSLSGHRRRQIARLVRAIVIDCAALDHRPDVIPIGHSIVEAAQDQGTRAAAKDRALRTMIKGVALTVG